MGTDLDKLAIDGGTPVRTAPLPKPYLGTDIRENCFRNAIINRNEKAPGAKQYRRTDTWHYDLELRV